MSTWTPSLPPKTRVLRQSSVFRRRSSSVRQMRHGSNTLPARAIADMAGPNRRLIDARLWETFLGNLQLVTSVHNLAYTQNVQHQLEFDQLDVQGRINKITPMVAGSPHWQQDRPGRPQARGRVSNLQQALVQKGAMDMKIDCVGEADATHGVDPHGSVMHCASPLC